MKMTIAVAALAGLLMSPAQVRAEAQATASKVETALARLEEKSPRDPLASPTPEIKQLIQEVGATKRLDAALILVRALAFSMNPIGQGESFSPFGSMPAAQALKANFGSQVLPILMYQGLTTKEAWMQTRLALTIRSIGTQEEIQRLNQVFSTAETRDPLAKQFVAKLTQPVLSFADDPALSQFDQIDKMIEELRKAQRKAGDKPKPPTSN
jgi:hypothetical protein